MRDDEVPQDDSFYHGHLRACYAVNRDGKYVLVTSRGWEVERVATAHELDGLEARLEEARLAVLAGDRSPLAYHMRANHMTPGLLARSAGISRWRVRRHLRPDPFRRLADRTLQRYAECLNLSVEDLSRVPETRGPVFRDDPHEP